jgi:ER degradation enhancer, mannosidase alpha-like 2
VTGCSEMSSRKCSTAHSCATRSLACARFRRAGLSSVPLCLCGCILSGLCEIEHSTTLVACHDAAVKRFEFVLVVVFAAPLATTHGPAPPVDRAILAARVRGELLHAWHSYKRHAWGHDELRPLSRQPRDWYKGASLHMTVVDTLSTLLVMGLKEEAEVARQHLVTNLRFDHDISVSTFEITIRVLGGLLSAYQFTADQRLLVMADELGGRLLPAFQSKSGMPYRFVNLRTGRTSGIVSNPAEIGTLILELGTLSKLTGKPAYFDKAKAAVRALHERRDRTTGLVGAAIDVDTGRWTREVSHVGGGIDSYYEYLLKCERLFGDAECGTMWRDAYTAMNKYVAHEAPTGLWYGPVQMQTGKRLMHSFGSLHAFLPAVLAMHGDLDRARRLQISAFRMWMRHGIEPEVFEYRVMEPTRPGYELRPEIMESTYYLYHFTKDPTYLEMGRVMFEGLVEHCRTENGYTVLQSVITKQQGDLMHSFLLAETLKYLYLLFDPSAIDFDQVVFNTEAHPLKRVNR